jgi:hypothetical protein
MKRTQTIVAALALAGAAILPARAADISRGVQTLDLSGGAAVLTHEFGAGNAGNTFSDRYNFTASSGQTLGALVSSLNMPGLGGVSFDSFRVYNSAGFSLDGMKQSAAGAPAEVWTINTHGLATDNYYLLVSGTVRNAVAGNYVGSVAVTAVPEPATYGMLLGGLGMVGWLARRRKV